MIYMCNCAFKRSFSHEPVLNSTQLNRTPRSFFLLFSGWDLSHLYIYSTMALLKMHFCGVLLLGWQTEDINKEETKASLP